ncbi:hypothetical protein HID58_095621 [Brassica napus]|uniref:Leucine-rich repeat-containing N-terminal plant-type domain-containing protein n=1 Tax=Brassica napus TaxID=3708 RepID=A0ABQ7X337_BRANA|nr:hypothetical protein HID58_095621 [Brassica napus]
MLSFMMVAKLVCAIFFRSCLWVLLVSSLNYSFETDINCLKSLKSQLQDPKAHLSNWIFGNYSEGYICKFFGVECWGSEQNRVLSINLGGYGLKGEFPSGVTLCTSMESLNLTGNNLYGIIPSEFFSFIPYLVTLDLSHNNFASNIPASLSNMYYLKTLLLDHNWFTGHFPSGLGSSPRLQQFSVSHNDLDGPVPDFYSMAIIAASISTAAFFPVVPVSQVSIRPLLGFVILIILLSSHPFPPVLYSMNPAIPIFFNASKSISGATVSPNASMGKQAFSELSSCSNPETNVFPSFITNLLISNGNIIWSKLFDGNKSDRNGGKSTSFHHLLKLLEIHHPISININFANHPLAFIKRPSLLEPQGSQHGSQLFHRDEPVSVLIKHIESLSHVLLLVSLLHDRLEQPSELLAVHVPITVEINLLNHLHQLLLWDVDSKILQ